jgi:hypothetical protein
MRRCAVLDAGRAGAAVIDGRCLCGAVTVRIDGAHDARVGACHCRMCQRWSGGVFLAFDVDDAGLTVTGPVSVYASTSFSERAFCKVCGSHLWLRNVGDATLDMMPGLFDAAKAFPLRSEVYTDRAMAAVQLAGDHPRETEAEYEAENLHVAGDAR